MEKEFKTEMDSVIELASDHAILNRGIGELLAAMTRRVMDAHLRTGNSILDMCFTKLNELLEENNKLKEEIKKMKDGPVPKPNLSYGIDQGKGTDHTVYGVQDESGEIIATITMR